MLMLAGCMEESAGIPFKAVDSNTSTVIRIDVAGASMAALSESLDTLYNKASTSTNPQVSMAAGMIGMSKMTLDPASNPQVARYESLRKSVETAGVVSIYVLLGSDPAAKNAPPTVRVLLRGETSRSESIAAIVKDAASMARELSSDFEIDFPVDATPSVEEIARGWYFVQNAGVTLPEVGDGQVSEHLDEILLGLEGGVLKYGMVISPALSASIAESMNDPEAAESMGPLSMVMMNFREPVLQLTGVSGSLTLGKSPAIIARAEFADETTASSFANQWNQMVSAFTGMMVMGAAPEKQDVAIQNAKIMSNALSLSATGKRASLVLDDAAWDAITK